MNVLYKQRSLFGDCEEPCHSRRYRPIITAVENRKGVLDVDTVKGCTIGMRVYPNGGCYGECYAQKAASRYGIDFAVSVTRRPGSRSWKDVYFRVRSHDASWYRIGTAGDPCHDWENTLDVCERLRTIGKTPVIITKHWVALSDNQLARLRDVKAVINTSTSGLDSNAEIKYRVGQIERIRSAGIRSICRVVTCLYGSSDWAKSAREKQEFLLSLIPVIDNPLRVRQSNERVKTGEIIIERRDSSIGGGKLVSLHVPHVYLGICRNCPDKCGVQ